LGACPMWMAIRMRYTRFIALNALIGMIIFFVLMITTIIISFTQPRILPSLSYVHQIFPISLAVSVYVGLFHFLLLKSKLISSKKKTQKRMVIEDWSFMFVLLIGSLLLGLLTYMAIIVDSATIMHRISPKENITLEVMVNSAWPSRRGLSGTCRYGLVFDNPKVSILQSVCIDREQWMFFSHEKPITVVLFGKKSYFGYDLKCCR